MCSIRKCIFLSPIALSLLSPPLGNWPNAQDKSRPQGDVDGAAAKRKDVPKGGGGKVEGDGRVRLDETQ